MLTSKRIFGLLLLALAAGLAGSAVSARADSGFRCGKRVVSAGDHMVEVRNRCGDPDFVAQRTIKRKIKVKIRGWVDGHEEDTIEEQTVDVFLDEWTYDLGPRRFIRFVLFENNRVVGVDTGGYGAKAVED
jgi:hypothetical protein